MRMNGYSTAIHGIHEPNALTRAFFSEQNVDKLQKCLQRLVFKHSGYRIDRQSDQQLFIIMRSIYYQYADNRNDNVRGQVKQLNGIVLDDSVPKIISQIELHHAYLRRASGQDYANQIERPIHVSSAGTKILPSVTSLF